MNDWIIVPGKRVGPITSETSHDKLRELFGEQNVRREDIYVGEGESKPGTVIFPDDPQKTLRIFWSDQAAWRNPDIVRLDGKRSLWKTDKGISLGTTLKIVERINGRPFILFGFGWDYGGTTIHGNRGRLSEPGTDDSEVLPREIRDKVLWLRFEYDVNPDRARVSHSVQGSRDFSSGHPAMQQLNPNVSQIFVAVTRETLRAK